MESQSGRAATSAEPDQTQETADDERLGEGILAMVAGGTTPMLNKHDTDEEPYTEENRVGETSGPGA